MSEVLRRYLERLHHSARRSGLLYAFPTRTIKRLDIAKLTAVSPDLPSELLERLLKSESGRVQFDLDINSRDERKKAEQLALYHTFRNGLARTAEAFRRETGVRSLWLAYPLFHVVSREDEDRRSSILAPIFLWPIKVETPLAIQGRVVIQRDVEAGGPKYNRSLDLWITEHLGLSPDDPHLDEFAATTLCDLERVVAKLYAGLRPAPAVDFAGAPHAIPALQTLQQNPIPVVLHSGILGLIQWEHQALIRDFEALDKTQKTTELLSDFLTGRARDNPPLNETPGEAHRFLITDADPSQQRAVWLARAGPGVVIHGPPGTGKSQTIVNIVADALAREERVLVVCQKRAAIDVVAERLKAHGLADLFCVAHDSESAREPTIRTLKAQVAQPITRAHTQTRPQRERLATEIERIEAQLDEYTRAICERSKVGLSYGDLLSRASKIFHENNRPQPIDKLIELFGDKTLQDLEPLDAPVCGTGRLWDEAEPLTNPWRFRIENISLGPIFTDALDRALGDLRAADAKHGFFITSNGIGSPFISTPKSFIECASGWLPSLRAALDQHLLSLLGNWAKIAHRDGVLPSASAALEPLLDLGHKLMTEPLDRELAAKYSSLTVADARAQLERAECMQRLFPKWWRCVSGDFRRARKSLRTFCAKSELTADEIARTAKFLRAWLDRDALRAGLASLPVAFTAHSDQQLATAVHCQKFAVQTVQALLDASAEPAFIRLREHFEADNPQAIHGWFKDIETAIGRARIAGEVISALDPFGKWLRNDFLAILRQRISAGESIQSQIAEIESSARKLESLQMLDESRVLREGAELDVLAALEQNQTTHPMGSETGAAWWAVTQLSAYLSWKNRCEHDAPILRTMSPTQFDEQRRRLADALKAKRELEAKFIVEVWREKQGARTRAHFSGVLVSRGRNSKRLREVVELGEPIGLFDFRPCWLTNPNTASQIFPLREEFFDLIVFDEASQCPVEQAVPMIFRTKRVVVSGDEKQLPPTAFFTSNFTFGDEEDTSEEDVDPGDDAEQQARIEALQRKQALEVKDLLDASKPLLRDCTLQIHYRSEHPALIRFSNYAFYDGQLQIPPSIHVSGDAASPLVLIEANGIYDKKKNPAEASKVIALLRELWSRDAKPPTVGVVTFNEVQKDLIENMLQEEAEADPVFRARYEEERARCDGQQDVGFFVKNLESVQGDERDVMIFSTTFGRLPDGKFRRFFGPINQLGGERRLNVAITRAKQRNYLITSMPLSEISERLASGTLATGIAASGRDYLHAYMQFVRAVFEGDRDAEERALRLAKQLSSAQGASSSTADEESLFEVEVRDAIEKKLNFRTETQVGDGGFRIDIAVKHPKHGGFVLGVECDGKAYHSDWTARARDVWRQRILEDRGWRIYRVWSTNWWLDRDAEIRKLHARLESLIG
jgi:primosomal replication protein N''